MKELIPKTLEIPENPSRDDALTEIARNHLSFSTLETRRSDSLDFRDVSVWGVRLSLQKAFELGLRVAGEEKRGKIKAVKAKPTAAKAPKN